MDEARGPEDRIEHIVREAEAGAQFEFNSAAWSAMEAKLDAAAKVPFNWWKLIFPTTGTAILLIVLLWPIAASDVVRAENLINEGSSKELPTDESKETNPKKSAGLVTDDKEVTSANESSPKTQDTASTEATNATKADDIETTSTDEADIHGNTNGISAQSGKITDNATGRTAVKANAVADLNEREIEEVSAVRERSNKSTVDNEVDIASLRADAVQKEASENVATDQAQVSYFSLVETDNTEINKDIEAITLSYQSAGILLPEPVLIFPVDSALYSEKSSEIQYFNKSRWALSFAVSADLSATGLEGFTDPGTMVGFGVEYFVNDKWSIQTGATYAVKKYTALGSEYETPDWISARPDDLLSASAVCRVIDIPLNIRRYFQNKKGNTFFVSTGVSTYLMLREDYNYEYTEERPGWLPFWSISNQNNHFLGILNLSVGYEKPLSKNLALGIEPFMKLPLTGIGAGRVRFLSFGTNIAIKLRK